MNFEEQVELQLMSSDWACKQADTLIKKLKKVRTNKERAKIITQLENIKAKLLAEHRYVDQMLSHSNFEGEEEDRGF